LDLPDNLHFSIGSTDSLIRTFNQNNTIINWTVIADSVTTSGFDTISVSMNRRPLDININDSVGVNVSYNAIPFEINVGAEIQVTGVDITGPAGALDDTVSSGQAFTVEAVVEFNSSVKDSARTAEIILPAGYSVEGSSVITLANGVTQTSGSWQVIAPANVPLSVIRRDSINVRIHAYDDNSGDDVTELSISPLIVYVIRRANLALLVSITEPEGAIDGTVSESQLFRMQAVIENRGRAKLIEGEQGLIAIYYPTGFQVQENDTVSYTEGDTISWWIRAKSLSATMMSSFDLATLKKYIKNTAMDGSGNNKQKTPLLGVKTNDKYIFKGLLKASQQNGEDIITIKLITIPRDENDSDQEASAAIDSVAKEVHVEAQGSISVASSTVRDTVSSGQNFTYRVQFDISGNVAPDSAILILPETFSSSNLIQNIPANNIVIWSIQASDTVSSTIGSFMGVIAYGKDKNSDSTIVSSLHSDEVIVEPRADLEILARIQSPLLAINSQIVSLGQEIVLNAWVRNHGVADITGTGQIRLELEQADSLELVEGSFTQAFSDTGQIVTWTIRAPAREVNATTIKFILESTPNDKNTGLPAYVAIDHGEESFPLTVRQKQLVVANISENIITEFSFRQGSENVALIALEILNEGFTGPEGIVYINGITLSFFEGSGDGGQLNLLDSRAVINMFEQIDIVNHQEYLYRTDEDRVVQSPVTFRQFEVTNDMINPVNIEFDNIGLIDAGARDTLLVLVTFQPSAKNRSFRLGITAINAYDVDPDIALKIIDPNGNLLGDSEQFVTELVSLFPIDPKAAFRNYPNPFGREYKETKIVFSLEHDSDVELRIFTITGRLVRTWKLPNLTRGVYTDRVRWDGKNDRGKTVLNGVYLCQIRIDSNDGISSNTYMLKIAFIK
jgi:hypothetical protein